jgi:hypothetical protein
MDRTGIFDAEKVPGYWKKCQSTMGEAKKLYKEKEIALLMGKGLTKEQAIMKYHLNQRIFR